MSTPRLQTVADPRADARVPIACVVAFAAILLWSGIRPHDYFTWFLEVLPALLGLAVLVTTYRRFRFTDLVYLLLLAHAAVLCVGGHYTYAEVPLFNWIRDHFHLSRNYYDRVGHFMQGFVPAIVAREVLLRLKVVKRGWWLVLFVISLCLAASAVYELFEWQVAVWTGTAADAFLGTQGDVWDTQEDMATCLVGSIVALLALSSLHDRGLRQIERTAE